ncbi:hypothetical protein ABZ791_12645 [Streptomyces huasconensis]|uniref:Uncharacterized protein n=1 Tax=Streptomyces huasconensis TaxID=1854574 RepID=A0ABV3LQD9_9ACTN
MTVSWLRSAAYAAKVVAVSLLVQAVMGLLLLTASGNKASDLGDFAGTRLWGFALLATAALTVARRLAPTAPRWKAVTVDSSLYTACLLLFTIAWYVSASGTIADAVDMGFIFLIAGLFTLQIPAAMLTATLAHRRLSTP